MGKLSWQHDVVAVEDERTGRAYQLWVQTPGRYGSSGRTYPLVVCLDAPWTFGLTRDAFRLLPLSRELPEAIVVGVAHDEADLRTVTQLRARDFTPTSATAPPETGVRLPAEQLGGGPSFRRLLAGTLLPLVHERYRTDGDATLVGHSFSALFGLDWLLDEPTAFRRWVLTSPSVWWDDRVIFAREEAQAATGADLPARVFLSMAEGDDPPGGSHFAGHARFFEQLTGRRRPGLHCTWARFPGESHSSVVSAAVVRGLREVFST